MTDFVSLAIRSLRAFGDLDRTTAARMLASWRYFRALTADDVVAVLSVFPPASTPDVPEHVDGWPVNGRRTPRGGES